MRIAINGFGRIGRCVLRALLEGERDSHLDVVALNSPGDPRILAHLLKYDSTYGTLPIDIQVQPDAIVCKKLRITCLNNTSFQMDWRPFNLDLVFECSGKIRQRETAERHLMAGASTVLISSPFHDSDITLIPGCNMQSYRSEKHKIVSMGSCTTNCLCPTLKVLIENFHVERGFATTIHSYTGDQRLLDGSHHDLRRARAAGSSLIPTKTGTSEVLSEIFPQLRGRFSCSAIRAPTSSVSLLELTVETRDQVDRQSVNQAFIDASEGELRQIIGYSDEPLVSVDYKKDSRSAVVDGLSTAVNGNLVRVLAWYDNEWAYATRMLETAEWVGKASLIEEPIRSFR